MIKKISVLLCASILSACNSSKNKCIMPEPKTIFYDFDSQRKEYHHYILLDGYERSCMDSIEMVKMAKRYAKNLKKGKPALFLRFYSSTDYFIQNEKSQPMHEINTNCLFTVSFDKDMTPNNFSFYNEKAEWVYRGPLWRPNGE